MSERKKTDGNPTVKNMGEVARSTKRVATRIEWQDVLFLYTAEQATLEAMQKQGRGVMSYQYRRVRTPEVSISVPRKQTEFVVLPRKAKKVTSSS